MLKIVVTLCHRYTSKGVYGLRKILVETGMACTGSERRMGSFTISILTQFA